MTLRCDDIYFVRKRETGDEMVFPLPVLINSKELLAHFVVHWTVQYSVKFLRLENGVELSVCCWCCIPWLLLTKLYSPNPSWNKGVCSSSPWHKKEFEEVRPVGRYLKLYKMAHAAPRARLCKVQLIQFSLSLNPCQKVLFVKI